MAEQLISALEEPFDPAQYRDEYHDRVLDLIRTKARGVLVVVRSEEVGALVPAMVDRLRGG